MIGAATVGTPAASARRNASSAFALPDSSAASETRSVTAPKSAGSIDALLAMQGIDAKVHLIYHTDSIEEARRAGKLGVNKFVRLEKRFAEPIATESTISITLSSLAAMLVSAMDRQGKGARRLEAAFFRTDGAVRVIAVDTGRPVTRPEAVDRLFRERLDALSDPLDPGFGFDLIRLSAGRTEIVVQQQRDLDATVHDNDELSALIDRIAARIGGKRVVVHLPQDTHIPERAALAAPAQHHLAASAQAAWPARAEGEPPLRPLRLFEKPEPIKVPFATVPDGPPHHFTWRRVTHAVVRVEGPERIAMEWWKQEGHALTRDYFRVEDEEGRRFWIFRDGLYERELAGEDGKPVPANWYLHGLFA